MRVSRRSLIDIFIFLVTTCSIVFFDRLTKIFFTGLLRYEESLPVIRDVLHMTLVYNTGIAFGFFKNQGVVFYIIPFLAIFGLLLFNIYYYRQNDEALTRPYIIAFSLILGGAIGNLTDRILYGYVIDFIDFRIWPVFNVGDSAISIGAVIIAVKCFQLTGK
jgi:signal peptidase II